MTEFLLQAFVSLSAEIQASGWLGMVAMLGLFAVGAASFMPRPLLCLVAGITYGYWGVGIAFAGTMAGACVAFGLGGVFSVRISAWSERYPRLKLVLDAVRSEGWKAVLLLRLAPLMPSSVQSVVFGLGGISFPRFFVATAIGIMPGILLEVMIGVTSGMIAEGSLHRVRVWLTALGILAGLLAVTLVARRARRMIAGGANVPGS